MHAPLVWQQGPTTNRERKTRRPGEVPPSVRARVRGRGTRAGGALGLPPPTCAGSVSTASIGPCTWDGADAGGRARRPGSRLQSPRTVRAQTPGAPPQGTPGEHVARGTARTTPGETEAGGRGAAVGPRLRDAREAGSARTFLAALASGLQNLLENRPRRGALQSPRAG